MVTKLESILLTLFLFALFVIQPSTSTQTENEKLAELTERVDKWQGKMEALETENVDIRADNVKLKANFKKLKLKIESLEKIIESKEVESCDQVEQKVSSPKKKRSPESNKKSEKNSNKNTKALINPLPTTCKELRARGHFADGIYLLADPLTNQINAYSCEFPRADSVVETPVGIVELKAQTVHFFAQRNTEFGLSDTSITFEKAELNEGGGMDIDTGVFTAPVNGIYHFEFSGLTSDKLNVVLRKDSADIALTAADFSFTNGNSFYSSISLATSLHLNANDQVYLYKSGDGLLYQDGTLGVSNTHFTGWLVTADATVLP